MVLCSGAWSAALADIVGFRVPVRPVKGQMMLLHWPSNLHYTLVTPEGFVSPRGGHQLVVGSTEAECLFDTAVRIRELRQLIDFATRFLGSIDEAEIIESWAGLRPGTPDDLPLVGAAPGWENLYVASGHYRKGILMAPLTARLLGELIIDGMRAPLLADLDPGRFAG